MGIYDNYEMNNNNRQRDLVLSINEFCFVQNETNGTIKTHVGPLTLTVSQQESLVTFNEKLRSLKRLLILNKLSSCLSQLQKVGM